MIARLPADKLAELVLLIHQWGHKKYYKRKELESLIGKLNHACYVVPTGRTFLRRLINQLRDSKRYWKSIRIPKECQLDLQWWISLNGHHYLILNCQAMHLEIRVLAFIITVLGSIKGSTCSTTTRHGL